MKKLLLCISIAGIYTASAQTYQQKVFDDSYFEATRKAQALYDTNQYKQSAMAYSKAFSDAGGKCMLQDRYNAACSWSLAGNTDSAITYLQLAANGRYTSYNHLILDPDLDVLHTDARWDMICKKVNENRLISLSAANMNLLYLLDTVMQDDQRERMKFDNTREKYGVNSKEFRTLVATMNKFDSVNILRVTNILDTHGWPHRAEVGDEGSQAVFMVIQHADISVQEKYLPHVRDAVKARDVRPSSLALLEDRIAVSNGKKQLYGTQLGMKQDGTYYLDELEDPDNVDKRRASVGLGPLADYLMQWNLKWDPATYKKEHNLK